MRARRLDEERTEVRRTKDRLLRTARKAGWLLNEQPNNPELGEVLRELAEDARAVDSAERTLEDARAEAENDDIPF
jgi:hypothetical protein